jgi:hypothetical protein
MANGRKEKNVKVARQADKPNIGQLSDGTVSNA